MLGLRHDVHWKNFGTFNLEPGILTVIRVRLCGFVWVCGSLIAKIRIASVFLSWKHSIDSHKL